MDVHATVRSRSDAIGSPTTPPPPKPGAPLGARLTEASDPGRCTSPKIGTTPLGASPVTRIANQSDVALWTSTSRGKGTTLSLVSDSFAADGQLGLFFQQHPRRIHHQEHLEGVLCGNGYGGGLGGLGVVSKEEGGDGPSPRYDCHESQDHW